MSCVWTYRTESTVFTVFTLRNTSVFLWALEHHITFMGLFLLQGALLLKCSYYSYWWVNLKKTPFYKCILNVITITANTENVCDVSYTPALSAFFSHTFQPLPEFLFLPPLWRKWNLTCCRMRRDKESVDLFKAVNVTSLCVCGSMIKKEETNCSAVIGGRRFGNRKH